MTAGERVRVKFPKPPPPSPYDGQVGVVVAVQGSTCLVQLDSAEANVPGEEITLPDTHLIVEV